MKRSAARILFVSGSDTLLAEAPAARSLNGASPRRGGVWGANFNPSAGQRASSTPPSFAANSSASLHLARSTFQVTDLPSRAPFAPVAALGNVTRNLNFISLFFF